MDLPKSSGRPTKIGFIAKMRRQRHWAPQQKPPCLRQTAELGERGACASGQVHDYLMDRDANLAVQLMTKASKLSMVSYGAPGILVILVSVRPALISDWIR
jgi:hypothetical protein